MRYCEFLIIIQSMLYLINGIDNEASILVHIVVFIVTDLNSTEHLWSGQRGHWLFGAAFVSETRQG